MKKILLVEDDDFFRSALKNILKDEYEVLEAPNGKMAREIAIMIKMDLIISDIQMPHFNGVELLEWVRENNPEVPVILMTGFSQILETHKAYELGAKDFLPKPFKSEDILSKVRKILDTQPPPDKTKEKSADIAADFIRIPIEDFITDKSNECAIFLKFSDTKFIKVAHRGGKIPEEKIQSLKEKGIYHLFVRKEDFAQIVGFAVNFSKVVSSSSIDLSKKARFLDYTGSLLVQQAFLMEIDNNVIDGVKDIINANINILTEDSGCLDVITQLSQHTDFLYAHSLGVSLLAVAITKNLGIKTPQTLFKVGMAGIFHDIGYKEIPKEILSKPRHLLSTEERGLIETHPLRGKEILEGIRNIPSDVIQMVYEHHQDLLGTGYPGRIEKSRLHPLSQTIYLADAFCHLVLKNRDTTEVFTPQEAVAKLKDSKLELVDAKLISSLDKLIPGFALKSA